MRLTHYCAPGPHLQREASRAVKSSATGVSGVLPLTPLFFSVSMEWEEGDREREIKNNNNKTNKNKGERRREGREGKKKKVKLVWG